MSHAQYLRDLLRPLGVCDLTAPFNGGELDAQGEALDGAWAQERSDQIARAVAEASGAEVRVLYSCHNLTAEQFEAGETYLGMMQENVETLKAALMD